MQKRSVKLRNYFLKDINPVIRFLIISDTALVGAAGLLGPVFALFVTGFIDGGNAAVAGVATGVFLFTRSVLQIPIAHFLDKVRGEKDDFWLMFFSAILISLTPLLYLVIHTATALYLVQFILGFFTAFIYPSFMAIFTRHIDEGKEGTEWGIYFTLTDFASAALAIIGGYVAATAGFPDLIVLMVALSLCGALLLLPVRFYLKNPFRLKLPFYK